MSSQPSSHQTFLFADLAGFTALTEVHGDEEAAEIVGAFCERVRALLPEHHAREVKGIGDAVMLRAEAASEAVRLGLRVVHEVGRRHGFPAVRVGMHTGAAVERDGDWFGATVNVAARVAGVASACEVLLTESTWVAAGKTDGVRFHDRGEERFKNVAAPVRLYAAYPAGQAADADWPIDPVCRMAVEPGRSAGTLRHRGVDYQFCSLECAGRFAQAPSDFMRE